jgi:hypothetical protein
VQNGRRILAENEPDFAGLWSGEGMVQKNIMIHNPGPDMTLCNPVIWVLLAIIALLILIFLPILQVRKLSRENFNLRDRISLANETRKTLAQILGGVILMAGVYFAWQNLKVAQNSLQVNQEGQITERFTRAIEQLVNEKEEIRIAGIYTLGSIAGRQYEYHWPIMKVLTAYVREKAPWPSEKVRVEPEEDIKAILDVIGKRKWTYGDGEPESLNLWKSDLRGAYLKDAKLQGMFFSDSSLGNAKLLGADLTGAVFGPYTPAGGRKLCATIFDGANLSEATLTGARLETVDLSKTVGLTKPQIEQACINDKTKFPGEPDDFKDLKNLTNPCDDFTGYEAPHENCKQ